MAQQYDMSADLNYYIEHQAELLQKYEGKYIVIADQKVLGACLSQDEAVKFALKTRKMGEFSVQFVSKGEDDYSAILSRVKVYAKP